MVMASALFAMEEDTLAEEMTTKAIARVEGNELHLNGDGQPVVTIPAINYAVESKLQGVPYCLKICSVTKNPQAISAEYLIDLMSGNENKRYSMKNVEGHTYIIPTAKPFVCICSPENNNTFFATREFSVKNGGTFSLTFDRDAYSVAVTHNGVTQQVDADTITNGIERYAETEIKSNL